MCQAYSRHELQPLNISCVKNTKDLCVSLWHCSTLHRQEDIPHTVLHHQDWDGSHIRLAFWGSTPSFYHLSLSSLWTRTSLQTRDNSPHITFVVQLVTFVAWFTPGVCYILIWSSWDKASWQNKFHISYCYMSKLGQYIQCHICTIFSGRKRIVIYMKWLGSVTWRFKS